METPDDSKLTKTKSRWAELAGSWLQPAHVVAGRRTVACRRAAPRAQLARCRAIWARRRTWAREYWRLDIAGAGGVPDQLDLARLHLCRRRAGWSPTSIASVRSLRQPLGRGQHARDLMKRCSRPEVTPCCSPAMSRPHDQSGAGRFRLAARAAYTPGKRTADLEYPDRHRLVVPHLFLEERRDPAHRIRDEKITPASGKSGADHQSRRSVARGALLVSPSCVSR